MIKKHFTDNLKKIVRYFPIFSITTFMAFSANLHAMDSKIEEQRKPNVFKKMLGCYATKELGFKVDDYAEMPVEVYKKIIKAPDLDTLQKKAKKHPQVAEVLTKNITYLKFTGSSYFQTPTETDEKKANEELIAKLLAEQKLEDDDRKYALMLNNQYKNNDEEKKSSSSINPISKPGKNSTSSNVNFLSFTPETFHEKIKFNGCILSNGYFVDPKDADKLKRDFLDSIDFTGVKISQIIKFFAKDPFRNKKEVNTLHLEDDIIFRIAEKLGVNPAERSPDRPDHSLRRLYRASDYRQDDNGVKEFVDAMKGLGYTNAITKISKWKLIPDFPGY